MAREEPGLLVTAARSGDADAWRELYSRHSRRLVLWLRSLPSLDVAASPDDVAADAWLTAAAKIGEFVGSDDDFAAWLFTIARHHASNRYRTAARRRTSPMAVEPGSEPVFGEAEPASHVVESQDATRALLAHLTPREAEVVACIDVVGLDVAATAAALGMKPTAVRVARHRALNRLRRLLAEDRADDPGPEGEVSGVPSTP